MKQANRDELSDLKKNNLYRQIRVLKNSDGIHAEWRGEKITLFCGNDYLGLSRHPRVIRAAEQALKKYGVGAGAARLVSGSTTAHEALEKKIARLKNKERALVFGSGYLANLGILTAFAREGDTIIMDKLCHASLVDGARLSQAELRVFPHKKYEKCEAILRKSVGRRKILLTESVFSMDGDLADLKELVRLKKKYKALLVVDDAHGMGVIGKHGHGATEKFSKEIDIIMGTLSKAIGGLGGFVAADDPYVDYLVNFSRPFIFTTALPPVLSASALESLSVIEKETALRKKLWDNIRSIHVGLSEAGFVLGKPESAILPVMIGNEKRALEAFQSILKEGVFIPAIRHPTVAKGKARLRITVSASHTEADIRALLKAFKSYGKKEA